MKHEIILGLTTTPGSDWRNKVEEMKKYGIKKIALFPTFLTIDLRRELYALLDEIEGLVIPHVHLRGEDMEDWEMKWFEKHGCEIFNAHMGEHKVDIFETYKDRIFIENHIHRAIPEKELEESAGICLDFQHWERAKKSHPIVAENTQVYAEKFRIGCCHLSPLPKLKNFLFRKLKNVESHYLISLDEIDYLKAYKKYFPKYLSIEMENSFQRQLEVKKYLEKILDQA